MKVWQGYGHEMIDKRKSNWFISIIITKFSNDIVNFSDNNSYVTKIKKKNESSEGYIFSSRTLHLLKCSFWLSETWQKACLVIFCQLAVYYYIINSIIRWVEVDTALSLWVQFSVKVSKSLKRL